MLNDSAAKGTSFDEVEKPPPPPPTSEDILKEKSKSKFFKFGSVIVYTMAVTGNGFLLSVFYLFMWDPQIIVDRPSNMAPDAGIFGSSSFGRLTADPLVADRFISDNLVASAFKSDLDHPDQLPAVPYHRIMSEEFTNDYIHRIHRKKVPDSGVVGGQPGAEAYHGIPSSAQEEYDNNASRTDQHAAAGAAVAVAADIQSKAHVSNSVSSEGDSSSSSSFGGTKTQHQRPQVLQT